MPVRFRLTVAILVIVASVSFSKRAQTGSPAVNESSLDESYFENHVRPLLVDHCYGCHSRVEGESMGELRLDTAAAIRRGGSRGPAIVAGDPDASTLLAAVRYDDPDMQMPPDGKLSDEQIHHLRTWIAGGAPDPRNEPDGEEDLAHSASPIDRDVTSHWAFVPPQPISRETMAEVATSPLDRTDRDRIDAFARHAAAQRNLTPAPPADNTTLHRRLTHDLHGLPSSADEITEFESDTRPDAMVRRIDRMLADPRFAERFTRHWLDVARYADTVGYAVGGKDRNLKGAYRYRDWVLAAIADDMPYDEMIRHQLAGDQTSSPENTSSETTSSETNNADAMGFLTLGRHFLRHDDTIDDRIDVITRGLLGLTVACARCHDHKFDPIPTIDYYSLYNVLENSIPPPKPESAASPLMLVDREPLKNAHVFVRGDRSRKGDVAPRQYLTAFREPDSDAFASGSGRLELAEAITDPTNPLTARVMVNRVWAHLLGRPLVDSPSDFGFRTSAPELQSVLDELAADFASDWSLKRLVRRIVQSRIYQQSVHAEEATNDPENRLWTHGLRKRRDFESMRDGLLVGCGYLDDSIGGPSVEITQPELTPRRTLYARIDRQNLPGLFRTFDFASPDMHSPQRYFTTVPQQPLFLLNHPQMAHAARLAVGRVVVNSSDPNSRTPNSTDEIAVVLFRQILGRDPTTQEQSQAAAFLSQPVAENALAGDPRDAWQYGIATWQDETLTDFRALKTFRDKRWQFEETFPSPGPMSYASITREGGHPADGDHGVVVRRWTSPYDGSLNLTGSVGRPSDQGDAINAIVQVRGDTVWQEKIPTGDRSYESIETEIRRGDVVDWIVHSDATLSHDGFRCSTRLSITPANGTATITVNAADEFSGPYTSTPVRSLDRIEQLAQVLFLSNEFLFVD